MYASGAWLLVSIAGSLAAAALGWLADDNATPAVFFVGVTALGFVVFVVLVMRGQRIIRTHLRTVAANPLGELPEHLQIGTARPMRQAWGVVVFLVAAPITLIVFGPSVTGWVVIAGGVATLIGFVRVGPSVLHVNSAYLDASGIRLPLLGIHAPWTSVAAVQVRGADKVKITIVGPLIPTGDLPATWTRRALAANPPGSVLTVLAARPEMAVWVAARYAARQHDLQDRP